MNDKNRADLSLADVSVDFRIANSAYRGDLVTSDEEKSELFASLRSIDSEAGFMCLETCNRVEWIVSGTDPAWLAELLSAKLISRWQEKRPNLKHYPSPDIFIGTNAAEHLFRVVSGLESFVKGEAQISGQFHRSLEWARKAGHSSDVLNRLGSIAGRLAKKSSKIGFQTNRSKGIHGLVLKFLDEFFKSGLADKKIIVAGMGEIGRKTAALIEETHGCSIIRVNRTIGKKNINIWKNINELKDLLHDTDALIIATGYHLPVFSKDQIDIKGREMPLLILDIGIPGQVEKEVENIKKVDYRNIDDLMTVNFSEADSRLGKKVEGEVERCIVQFRRFCLERDMVALLDGIQKRHEDFSREKIPDFVKTHLSSLEPNASKQIEAELKGLLRGFTNEMFSSVHSLVDKYRAE